MNLSEINRIKGGSILRLTIDLDPLKKGCRCIVLRRDIFDKKITVLFSNGLIEDFNYSEILLFFDFMKNLDDRYKYEFVNHKQADIDYICGLFDHYLK